MLASLTSENILSLKKNNTVKGEATERSFGYQWQTRLVR